jgi:GNAT superfamily N-acetyltransferase
VTHTLVRRASEQDAEAVARLSTTWGYHTDGEVIRHRLQAILRSDSDLLIVAVHPSGRVMGWLQAHMAHKIGSGLGVEIVGLVVDPAVRRQGVGSRLVRQAERWASARSAETILVRSNVERVESHRFYPALGYERSKTQAVYQKPLGD